MSTNRHEAFSHSDSNKQHPATLKLTWCNTNATFKVYDKNTKASTLMNLPMKFMVVDSFATITGWDDKSGTSFYSNEVKNINAEQLIVKNGNGTVMAGIYSDIKLGLEEVKAKYSTSLYVVFADGTLANIILAGKNNVNWFEFRKSNKSKLTRNWIGIGNPTQFKKGSITWYEPEFQVFDTISDDEDMLANAGYDALQDYKNPTPVLAETTIGAGQATDAVLKNMLDSVRDTSSDIPDEAYDDNDLPF